MTKIENYENKNRKLTLIDVLFIAFCFFPFIIPNPIVVTNIQPYAAMLGTVELLLRKDSSSKGIPRFFGIAWITLFVSIIVLLFSGIEVASFRAFFNYYSVAVIPLALYLIFSDVKDFPEEALKILIIVWFAVSSIQFFIDRSFLTGIIGGVRFSYSYRGVVGLASEPSFLGIACFYFLHMVMKFKKNKNVFAIMVLIMGIVYAQSMMGIMFIGAFVLVYVLDTVAPKTFGYVLFGGIFAIIIFWILLKTVLSESRLNELLLLFSQEGLDGVLEDESAGNRYDSLVEAIRDSFNNYLLPLGFDKRIGSGYGGFLCELGMFAIPILCCISSAMSKTFEKKRSQVIYFIVITALLFNNTQIGNPLLLFVIPMNLYFSSNDEKMKGEANTCKRKELKNAL